MPFGASLALGSVMELLLGPITGLVIAVLVQNLLFVACHNLMEKWFIVV